jgi:membrane protein YdbS with pleckstrin-like domain
MLTAMKSAWFSAKRYGYGAGLPVAWQGWAVLAGFVVLVLADFLIVPRLFSDPLHGLIAAQLVLGVLLCVLLVIAARTTRGGWRWRWGQDD